MMRLTLAGDISNSMTSNPEYWIADSIGIVKEVLSSSVEMNGNGSTTTKTSVLADYDLQ